MVSRIIVFIYLSFKITIISSGIILQFAVLINFDTWRIREYPISILSFFFFFFLENCLLFRNHRRIDENWLTRILQSMSFYREEKYTISLKTKGTEQNKFGLFFFFFFFFCILKAKTRETNSFDACKMYILNISFLPFFLSFLTINKSFIFRMWYTYKRCGNNFVEQRSYEICR